MSLLIVLFICVLVFAVFVIVPRKPAHHGHRGRYGKQLDHEVLAEAEEEIADLDATISPEEADDELPDWGPGVPRRPRDQEH